MKMKFFYIAIISIFLQSGCTEPFEIETQDFESVLVVESTITNEMKQQVVKLSRTSALENPEILFENGANVSVTDDTGNNYTFSQDSETGFYVSDEMFQAQLGTSYVLNITTSDGRQYSSSEVPLPETVAIDEVYAERIVDPTQDKDGVQILVNTEDKTGNAKYFRYEYEETYKVVVPIPSRYIGEIINYNPDPEEYEIIISPREPEEVCYSSSISTGIVQTTTIDLNENRVFRFPVHYLPKSDIRLRSRYSILVKQYVQSIEAFTFYKTIQELGSVESLLSQGQPGYVTGNISSKGDNKEKVLGFFEVSSIATKRIFFNYDDFGLSQPPFIVKCESLVFNYDDNTIADGTPNQRNELYKLVTFFDYQFIPNSLSPIFTVTRLECSVCTSFSSNIRPDFWED